MSNVFYEETILRQQYNLVKKIQYDKEFSKYANVKFEDRLTGKINDITIPPSLKQYPELYIVDYKMPVFVNVGQLRTDWHGVAKIKLSYKVLTDIEAKNGPHVTFTSNFEPFNHHVKQNQICSGNAWVVANYNGLWHFIISLGALINQDEFVCAEGGHLNRNAYDFWANRGRKPVSVINWPLDLLNKKKEIKVIPSKNKAKSTIKIIKKTKPKTSSFNRITVIKKG